MLTALGLSKGLALIAGPCVIESEEHVHFLAREIKKIVGTFIFKASFDKANRSSVTAYRGPGLKEGLRILKSVRDAGFPVNGLGESVELKRGRGCAQCGFTGYESRLGIFELLDVDDDLRRLMVTKSDSTVLKAQAVKSGMRSLKEDGWNKVLAGVTTADEVLRVAQEV